jgi:hypothetical protein
LLQPARRLSDPSEVQQAATQEQDLWRAGGSLFAGPGYEAYRIALQRARRTLEEENLKLGWFRDYDRVRAEFRQVLQTGRGLLADVQALKQERLEGIARTLAEVRQRLADLSAITLSINERGLARKSLTQAEVMLQEAETFAGKNRFEEARERLAAAEAGAKDAEEAVVGFLGRYLDQRQVSAWRILAEQTVRESELRRTTVIVVGKLERKLTVYQAGVPRLVCDIGLGFNGLADKLHAGDSATPEGRYRVIKKNPSSRFYKALLINHIRSDEALGSRRSSSVTIGVETMAGRRLTKAACRGQRLHGRSTPCSGGTSRSSRMPNAKTLGVSGFTVRAPLFWGSDLPPDVRQAWSASRGRDSDAEAKICLAKRLEALTPRGLYILIDTAENRLVLKKGGEVVREAVVSCGSGGILKEPNGKRSWVFDTPRGQFHVESKLTNPYWVKPDWAFIEEGEPIPVDTGSRKEHALGSTYSRHAYPASKSASQLG